MTVPSQEAAAVSTASRPPPKTIRGALKIAVATFGGAAGQEAVRDTILVVAAPAAAMGPGDWGVVALVGLASVCVAALLAFLWRLELYGRRLADVARRVEEGSRPVLERAAVIVDDVEDIARSLRAETEHLTGSVRALSDRMRQASTHMETRIDEFNALLEVMQAEAEETFLRAASAVRGVSAGVRALESGRKGTRGGRAEDARTSAGRVEGGPAADDGREPSAEIPSAETG